MADAALTIFSVASALLPAVPAHQAPLGASSIILSSPLLSFIASTVKIHYFFVNALSIIFIWLQAKCFSLHIYKKASAGINFIGVISFWNYLSNAASRPQITHLPGEFSALPASLYHYYFSNGPEPHLHLRTVRSWIRWHCRLIKHHKLEADISFPEDRRPGHSGVRGAACGGAASNAAAMPITSVDKEILRAIAW